VFISLSPWTITQREKLYQIPENRLLNDETTRHWVSWANTVKIMINSGSIALALLIFEEEL
jgi:hypothetical protein